MRADSGAEVPSVDQATARVDDGYARAADDKPDIGNAVEIDCCCLGAVAQTHEIPWRHFRDRRGTKIVFLTTGYVTAEAKPKCAC